MEDLVIVIEEDAERHQETHPHQIHIYSEIDKVDHPFGVKPEATVAHIIECFYHKIALQSTPLDRFKCEDNSRDVSVFPSLTLEQLAKEVHCTGLIWIFTNEAIHVSVAGREHDVNNRNLCFEEVVRLRFGSYETDEKISYTVSYRHADENHPDGELVKGQCVRVKDGTRFHVKRTNRS